MTVRRLSEDAGKLAHEETEDHTPRGPIESRQHVDTELPREAV